MSPVKTQLVALAGLVVAVLMLPVMAVAALARVAVIAAETGWAAADSFFDAVQRVAEESRRRADEREMAGRRRR